MILGLQPGNFSQTTDSVKWWIRSLSTIGKGSTASTDWNVITVLMRVYPRCRFFPDTNFFKFFGGEDIPRGEAELRSHQKMPMIQ